MPYMTARTDDVQGPLFLRKFGVPFWALARVFGRDPMYWYRIECGLGRFSVVGTTVRRAELPEHLLADEHHQTLDGQKVYLATTVGVGLHPGCRAGDDGRHRRPEGGLRGLQAGGPRRRPGVCPQDRQHRRLEGDQGGLEGSSSSAWSSSSASCTRWLKIRERGKHLKDQFAEVSRRVWEAYHAPDRRCFGQRLRSLRELGDGAPRRGRPGEGPRPVPEARPLVDRVPPSRRPPDQQHARPADAWDESLLRPRSAPAWLAGGLSAALPGLGVAVELRPLAPGDDARERRLAVPRRAAQPASLP